MGPSTASEISIDVSTANETNHPIFFKQVITLLLFTAAAFFKEAFIPLLGAAATLGDMVMPPVLTVTGFFKEGFILLLVAAEQLDDDVNHAIPHAPIVFILGSLIGFAGVKAQGDPNFPFKTHETLIKCSITSLLFFGIAWATQNPTCQD